MAHANARTNLLARRLIIERVAAGWPAAQVAEQLGVSRATVYKLATTCLRAIGR
jgi:DNA-binding NarL/FixJ family response regulator